MSNKVEMSGFITAQMKARTVKDLRAFVRWLDKYKVSDSKEIDLGSGNVYVELTNVAAPAEWTECGEHIPPDTAYDLLISTHDHDSKPATFDWMTKDKLKEGYKQAPNNYEEALEQALDRYGDEARPE